MKKSVVKSRKLETVKTTLQLNCGKKATNFPTKSTQHANRVIKFVLLKNKQNIVVISE